LESTSSSEQDRLEETLDSFNKAWLKYWESYLTLQDQLYESIRAARELSWLAATDPRKLSEINRLQRELFAGIPRRLDYTPLGQISQDLDSAPAKIAELEGALQSEEDGCEKMAEAIEILKAKIVEMKEALRVAQK
jgi:hypothetical protein